MLHLVGNLDSVLAPELMGPRGYRTINRTEMLPMELANKGFRLEALEQGNEDPVILKDRNGRIVAWWDDYPSLTELFELPEKLNER